MSFVRGVVAGTMLFLASCGPTPISAPKEAWDEANDPLTLGSDWQRTLADLPTEGRLSKTPWTDTYWPSSKGGIAARWLQDGSDAWRYRTPTIAQLRRMSPDDISALSPAEKFDILNGNYNYPTVATERGRTSPRDEAWFGICHGWAPAAYNFDEPAPTTVSNADGLEIAFGSSDIKALLSYYQGQISDAESSTLGNRCDEKIAGRADLANLPECRDTNAGAFHIVLTNMIALRDQSFVAEVTRDAEVWNQPVHAFKSRILSTQGPSPRAARGTVKETIVETKMTYTVEVDPQWDTLLGTSGHSDKTASYKYRLELDANGEIIGGEWITNERPDFLWTQAKPSFTGAWRKLKDLYEAATNNAGN